MAQGAFSGSGALRPFMVEQDGSTKRIMRRPEHTFYVEHKAFQIQPFLIAPVLPGETMRNLLMQARAVTDPIANKLIGWWLEHYIFYVKHRDLDDREEFVDMMLNPAWSDDNVDAASTNALLYTYNGAVDWVTKCLNRVVDTYFRDDDETYATGTLDGIPMAHVKAPGWMDSITPDATYTGASATQDVSVLDPAGTDILYASELATYMRQWQLLRNGGLTQQSYEEYLATYGIRVPREELHIPELIRYSREWQYPSNTVTQGTGAVTSAVSWSVAERADKDRWFREPGFIFGVTCARPKLYFAAQRGAAAGLLNNVYAWLPAVLSDDPQTSWKKMPDAADGGPFLTLPSDTGGWWVDVADLYRYGDQFVNVNTGSLDGTRNQVALPNSGALRRYLAQTDLDAMFTSSAAQKIKQDGIVNLNIATRSVPIDPSPGVVNQTVL